MWLYQRGYLYSRCKATGSFIVIDRLSHVTVGAGLIAGAAAQRSEARKLTPEERAARLGQRGISLWLTGVGSAEASYRLERALFERGYVSARLDGAALKEKTAWVAEQFNGAGIVCVVAVPEGEAPREDAAHAVLAADSVDIEKVIELLRVPQAEQPDFFI